MDYTVVSDPGVCAICGADAPDYNEDEYWHDSLLYVPFQCCSCGAHNIEIWTLQYCQTDGFQPEDLPNRSLDPAKEAELSQRAIDSQGIESEHLDRWAMER